MMVRPLTAFAVFEIAIVPCSTVYGTYTIPYGRYGLYYIST